MKKTYEDLKLVPYENGHLEIQLLYDPDQKAWEVYDIETQDGAYFKKYKKAQKAFDFMVDTNTVNLVLWPQIAKE